MAGMAPAPTAPRATWSEALRLLGVGVLSGLMVGLGAAICARVLMRLIALAIGHAPMLTTATFELIQTGLDHGILMGLLFVAIHRVLPGGVLAKGAAFGILLFALACVPFVLPFLGELSAAPVLATGLFATLFLVMGIAEAAAVAWLERRLPAPRKSMPSLAGYGILTSLAVYTVLSFVVNAVSFLLGELLPLPAA